MTRLRILMIVLAANAPTSFTASSPFVSPAAPPPGVPLQVGQDAGAGGFLVFTPGADLRLAAHGAWGYNVANGIGNPARASLDNPGFPVLRDGGTAFSMATCATLTMADAGLVQYPDGGTITLSPWNPLSDGDLETFTLNSTQTTVFACSFDGGLLSVSKRGN